LISKNIERPEKIVSMRQVVYDTETYDKLAKLWEKYYEEFPSEDAYANWMYAARYAGWENYESLLNEGLNEYIANPTMLYLSALLKHGSKDNLEAISLLERAVELDPSYLDPWFALAVDYMGSGNMEKADAAFRKLLEEGAISDEVMDYNYNVLTLLDKNAILITNGDNDTYPIWILTGILNFRPDVRVVNRSLLNSEWYPIHIIKNEGIPNFITQNELNDLRSKTFKNLKSKKIKMQPMGLFSDTLLTQIINSASKENRPVYLSATLYSTNVINEYRDDGANLGLVTQIVPSNKNYSNQIKQIVNKWIYEFRTAGLKSWQLNHSKKADAGKRLMMNYAGALSSLMEAITKYAPGKRLELFNWYKDNILDLIPSEKIDKMNSAWCNLTDIKEIRDWCKSKNYIK
jgi:tetratricopeptide (TPR) repeat protein